MVITCLSFTPELLNRLNICKSMNVILYINRLKSKNHIFSSEKCKKKKKNLDEVHDTLMTKFLSEREMKEIHLNTIRDTYDKSIENILNNGQLKCFL